MKKILMVSLCLVLTICLVLTGCSTTPSAASQSTNAPALSEAAQGTSDAATADETSAATSGEKFEIVMIAKTEGLAWFDSMKEGVASFNEDHDDVNAYQHSPEGADATKQAAMVEDYIAKGVDAICIVPNDPEALKTVVKKAKDAGIVVVIHEGASLAGIADYDLEVIDNYQLGQVFGQRLGEAMGGKGKYASTVGGLTMETHMVWWQGAIDYIKENFPDMELVNEQPYEDSDDAKIGYDIAKEVLKAYPDLTGYLACTVESGSSMCKYLQETNNKNVMVSGLAVPSAQGNYIKEGWCACGAGNSPFDAGYATVNVAYKILKGETIGDTVDLGKPGLEKCTVKDGLIQGNAIIEFTAESVDDYNF